MEDLQEWNYSHLDRSQASRRYPVFYSLPANRLVTLPASYLGCCRDKSHIERQSCLAETTKGQPIGLYELQRLETYIECNLETEKPDTGHETDDDTDAGCEILCDVVCIIDHQRYQQTSDGLERNGSPNNPVVTAEEALFCNLCTILENNS